MSKKEELKKLRLELTALREVIERLSPHKATQTCLEDGACFVWQGDGFCLVPHIQSLPLDLLLGIERVKKILLSNSEKFAKGLPANNALLWGVRGMGKSSLVKSVFVSLNKDYPSLKIIEIHREDIGTLPHLLQQLREKDAFRFILFCDDLSFEEGETSYKSLKAVLEGGLEGRPDNVLFYATSNRRHILARKVTEQNEGSALMPSDVTSEKISLSDRFGLWLGFHNCDQDTYLDMISSYIDYYQLKTDKDEALSNALEWSVTRGARSGRVAWQYAQHLAGELGVKLTTAAE